MIFYTTTEWHYSQSGIAIYQWVPFEFCPKAQCYRKQKYRLYDTIREACYSIQAQSPPASQFTFSSHDSKVPCPDYQSGTGRTQSGHHSAHTLPSFPSQLGTGSLRLLSLGPQSGAALHKHCTCPHAFYLVPFQSSRAVVGGKVAMHGG